MGYYVQLTDIKERIAVLEEDLEYADDYINSLLASKSIQAPFPQPVPTLLKQLAVLVALHRACVRLAQAEDTTLMEKAKMYKQMADDYAELITPTSLGIQVGTAFVSGKVQRG